MPRIRSVHPGLFTDEAFVSVCADAQVLFIGLLTEADDQGVFEWKPLTIRMRLRPTKDGSVELLLAELEAANMVRNFSVGGRKFGAIRNFRKWQRPKKPNAVHPITPEMRIYVALELPSSEADDAEVPSSSEPVGSWFPTGSEIAPQREEIRGRRLEGGDEREEGHPRARGGYAFRGKVIRLKQADYDTWRAAYHSIPDLLAELQAIDDRLYINPPPNFDPAKYFGTVSGWLRSKHEKLVGKAPPAPTPNGDAPYYERNPQLGTIRTQVLHFLERGIWYGDGKPPNHPRTRVPQPILDEFRDRLAQQPGGEQGMTP